jgi:hygromycin-B 4-O-kinase
MDAISRIDVSDTAGWGPIDGDGQARFGSWADYLQNIEDESFPGLEHGNGNKGIFEQGEFDFFFGRMTEFVDAMPANERALVHGDRGWDNVLVLGDEITAVIDWDMARYGDPLFDPARNDLYYAEADYRSRFIEYFAESGRGIENFEERWLCCQLWETLFDLRWYTVAEWPEPYGWIKARMRFLLGEGSAVG